MFINDLAFFLMPYQAEAIPAGPQNITRGTIALNGEYVHAGWAQYYSGFVEDKCEEFKISSITEVDLYNIESSSPQAMNSLLDDIGYNIDQGQGLKKLKLHFNNDENDTIQEWPLSQILARSPLLEHLEISHLHENNAASRSTLLNFCSEIVS